MDTLILDKNKYEEFLKEADRRKISYYPIKKLNAFSNSIMEFFCEFFSKELNGFTGEYSDTPEEKYYFTNGKYGSDTHPSYRSTYGKYYIVDEKIVTKKLWEDRKAYCGTSLKSFKTKLNIKTDVHTVLSLGADDQLKIYTSRNGIYAIKKDQNLYCLHSSFLFERKEVKQINSFKNSVIKYTIKEVNPVEMELIYFGYMKELMA